MSPRAAWRLEGLGFSRVFDYVGGKVDWRASGLPTEGPDAEQPRAGAVARRDVPTCAPSDRLGEARARVRQAGWDACVVVNEERVVLGRVRGSAFDAPGDTPLDHVMERGPTTIRPDEALEAVARRLRDQDAASVLVTTPDGRLVGVLTRADAERRLAEHGAGRTVGG